MRPVTDTTLIKHLYQRDKIICHVIMEMHTQRYTGNGKNLSLLEKLAFSICHLSTLQDPIPCKSLALLFVK